MSEHSVLSSKNAKYTRRLSVFYIYILLLVLNKHIQYLENKDLAKIRIKLTLPYSTYTHTYVLICSTYIKRFYAQ